MRKYEDERSNEFMNEYKKIVLYKKSQVLTIAAEKLIIEEKIVFDIKHFNMVMKGQKYLIGKDNIKWEVK